MEDDDSGERHRRPEMSDHVADSVEQMLNLDPVGRDCYRAQNLPGPSPVVFGGQILAQTVVAASRSFPAKQLKSLHTLFARSASPEQPLEVVVDRFQDGRSFASAGVSIRQGDRHCSRSLALLHDPETDLIRHAVAAPEVPGPEETPGRPGGHPWWELRIVGDVDLQDPDQVGPPELYVWSRFRDGPDDLDTSQALLAFASDGLLIATAMRPHLGIGQAMAHVSISTSVVAQTLSFHEPFDAREWLLLAHRSPYAGRGRSYGEANVFTEDGRLVASYTQENVIRNFPAGEPPPTGHGGRGE